MSILYRGPPIVANYQVSFHLAKRFQRRLKCEKLTANRRRTQRLTLPLARWAKNHDEPFLPTNYQ